MKRGANLFFNCVTFAFMLLTIGAGVMALAIAGGAMEAPLFAPETTDVPPPTVAMLSSPTPGPSWTPSITPVPTNTATPTDTRTPTSTATPTATLTGTATLTPSITTTSSITPTFTLSPTNTLPPPTFTPTKTPTPTPSHTPTPTATPTGPTATPTSQYAFIMQPSSLILRENFANAAGCAWQGIAGQITTDRGEAVSGVQVRVVDDAGGALTTLSGTNTLYGPAGWEIVLGNQPIVAHYQVSLWADGLQVSPAVDIVFPGTCQQNLATVNFIQTRPL